MKKKGLGFEEERDKSHASHKHIPKKNTYKFFTNNKKKKSKSIWVPKKDIIHVVDVLNKRKKVLVMVLGQGCLRNMIGKSLHY